MIQVNRYKQLAFVSFIMFNLVQSSYLHAECRDLDAVTAADELALKFFVRAELFDQGKVLKRHLPSKRKETASYIKDGENYYTFFGLVDIDCNASIIKRTHPRK
ncbi:hypothetical protein MED121_00070 [Marinomonas sp. MED121]|uniref:hypothetical protein n=1 Tax=Marinomonas sp. MED121 TaxID=314277 RepID=UPI0000690155|nr:hypothetical protein [Marinomonas sp. MED121]EAQ63294.1 hypothetical protein MED121_00070 [Marinomonas sp. MED121]